MALPVNPKAVNQAMLVAKNLANKISPGAGNVSMPVAGRPVPLQRAKGGRLVDGEHPARIPQRLSTSKKVAWQGLLDLMRKTKVPLTREHFLNLQYMGDPPRQLNAEQEAELPPQFRRDPYIER